MREIVKMWVVKSQLHHMNKFIVDYDIPDITGRKREWTVHCLVDISTFIKMKP